MIQRQQSFASAAGILCNLQNINLLVLGIPGWLQEFLALIGGLTFTCPPIMQCISLCHTLEGSRPQPYNGGTFQWLDSFLSLRYCMHTAVTKDFSYYRMHAWKEDQTGS